MPTGHSLTRQSGDNDINGLELGQAVASAATTAGAWAWKRREERFENPFIDFLKRR